GILVPALAKAREQAKRVASKAAFDSIGKGLEMFRNDVKQECPGDSYPSSGFRGSNQAAPMAQSSDDPTEEGYNMLSGAQWLVRYLLGKDLRGAVARKHARHRGH